MAQINNTKKPPQFDGSNYSYWKYKMTTHISVFSDGLGYNGQSWTVQCEILQHEHLGVDPLDEEQVPQLPNDGPPLFDIFGLGQQVLAPIAAHDPLPNMEAKLNEQEEQNIQVQ